MWSLYNIVCGVMKNSCRSKVMALSNKRPWLSPSRERGLSMDSGVTEYTWGIDGTQWAFDDLWWVNAFIDDIFASVMASNTIDEL